MEQTTENDRDTGHAHTGELTALRFTGKDARDFLQGQLTNDLDLLRAERPLLAGWNTPKGRLLCISWLLELEDSITMVLPAELAASTRQRLQLFILRADVQIQPVPVPVVPVPATDLPASSKPSLTVQKDITTYCFKSESSYYMMLSTAPDMALRIGAGGLAPAPNAYQEWRRLMIRCGVPSIWQGTTDSFVPQMVNLDLCGGISFSKGCYVGQEIVARTQNLGRIKRRMFGYEVPAATPCAPGHPIVSSGETVGQVVDAVRGEKLTEILAVVRLDAVDNTLTLVPTGAALVPRPLPYTVA